MNRGIARRTVFETRGDIRSFLAALAWEVRREDIEVHAYAFLATHFHLLVYSPRGRLGEVMRRAVNCFVRRFNRLRRRDGSLFRGRYRSRPVTSLVYRRCVVRYIDDNPVAAGLVTNAQGYPHSSARAHATGERPPWLSGLWIDQELGRARPGRPGSYEDVFTRATASTRRLVENRIRLPPHVEDPLDDLVGAATPGVYAWMVRKALLADQTKPGIEICDPQTILAIVASHADPAGGDTIQVGSARPRPVSDLWRVALLRDLGGFPYTALASFMGRSPSWCKRVYALHAELMTSNPAYTDDATELAQAAISACHQS